MAKLLFYGLEDGVPGKRWGEEALYRGGGGQMISPLIYSSSVSAHETTVRCEENPVSLASER